MHLFKRFVLLFLVMVMALVAWLYHFASTPLQFGEQPIAYDLKSGSNIKLVSSQLVDLNVLNERYRFWVLMRVLGFAGNIKAGNYLIKPELSPFDLGVLFTEGSEDTQYSITFVEGVTFSQMRESLREKNLIRHLSTSMTDTELLREIGASETHPEGLFFPDTYFFTQGMSDLEVLKRAYIVMQSRLEEAWQSRASNLPYKTPYEALIMASIVEKETGKASERPEIAGVFINRLNIGMRLQTDPTVIYGMGDSYDGNIRKRDLLRDTPYNTYTRGGLPPTPIAMPGWAALQAAMHPATTKSLYFVGKGDGSHEFSANLDEHNKAVQHYQLKR